MDGVRIYIADQRTELKLDNARVRNTLSHDPQFGETIALSINHLLRVNEWEIDNVSWQSVSISAQTLTILVPLVNKMCLKYKGEEKQVDVGEIVYVYANESFLLCVSNNAGTQALFQEFTMIHYGASENFLVVRKLPNLNENINNIQRIDYVDNSSLSTYIGAFVCKSEFILPLETQAENAFVYTLEGCFEVEGRLLYDGDALYMPAVQSVDVECLSSRGIIFILAMN